MENETSPNGQTPKRKRGRRRKNGVIDGGIFCRSLLAIHAVDNARASGLKFESAMAYAARRIFCSISEIKRVLAKYRPRNAQFGLFIDPHPYKLSQAEMERNRLLGLPEVFWKNPTVWSWGIGPLPRYPRVNKVNSK